MDPAELRHLIDRSREIHTALHNPKGRSSQEEAVYRFARGSIVADRDLSAGEVLDEAAIWARRPGNGQIAADQFDILIGRRVNRDIKRNTQLRWLDLD
jgi:N-acetylneuraminate synthase